jgi:hypothetical protein
MAADRTGGCACGSVRYRLAAEPFDAGWCHCRDCQLNSGSPAMAFASVSFDDFVVEQGADLIRSFASSDHARRSFCGSCGTPLHFRENEGATIDFTLATLDDPNDVPPAFHIFYASRIAWEAAGDGLPRHDRRRRDEPGVA